MKQFIYTFGFLATFLISTGNLFRFRHWPHAGYLLFFGFLCLIMTIFALLGNLIKHAKSNFTAYNIRVFAGILAGLLIATGSMFKLNHYPTASLQLTLGMCLLNFIFLPMFFYQLYKQSLTIKQN